MDRTNRRKVVGPYRINNGWPDTPAGAGILRYIIEQVLHRKAGQEAWRMPYQPVNTSWVSICCRMALKFPGT
jgi:hypothetical protein